MINYMVEIIYSEKISEVENMLKIYNMNLLLVMALYFLVFMR